MERTKNKRPLIMGAIACVLALVACAVVASQPLSAQADPEYKITVSNVNNGSTYSAYKVFDATYDGTHYAYSIKSNNPFYAAVVATNLFALEQTSASGDDPIVYSVVLNNPSANMATLAAALNNVASKGTAAATVTASSDSDITLNVTTSGPGYYLVDTTTGTICSLDTTNPTASVTDKNSKPSVEKKVQESTVNNGDYGYQSQSDASVGDTVSFRTKITVTKGAQNYVLHDTLSTGLTLNTGSFKFGTSPNPADATDKDRPPAEFSSSGITITTDDLADGESFTIRLSDSLHNTFLGYTPSTNTYTHTSRDLYVFYSATLNDQAVVGSTGNPNDTYLAYGDNNQTTHSKTTTYTWPINVVKYTGNDASTNRLAGASFTLTKATVSGSNWTANGNSLSFVSTAENTYKCCDPSKAGAMRTITTTSAGTFSLSGLDTGNYLLTETAAPDGYNKIAQPIRVTITASDYTVTPMTVTYSATSGSGSNSGTVSSADSTINVQNNTGTELPSAGGMGTTLLYVVGAALVVFAGTALVARRRAARQ